MREKLFVIISVVFGVVFHFSNGCGIVDHPLLAIPIQVDIEDVYEGIVISRDTTDIEGISSIRYGETTLAGPYFDISIENSQLIVRTNEAFKSYEEVEVEHRVSITLAFNCAGGSTLDGLFLWIDITDTNNNAPMFLPSNEYEFVIMPPLPPRYYITGCYNDPIIVRDIDLTTQYINFTIEDSPYFEIEYDAESSTVVKQFNAQLRTKTLLRSLNASLVLQITATDVALAGPPITTIGVVRIVPDAEFQFPEELVFSQTFYLANYTDDHQINLLETISLRQGFDEYVNFTLEGVYAEHFGLVDGNNQVSLEVVNHLPEQVRSEKQILLELKAQRNFTSGASATIIVQFSEELELQFEKAINEGLIVNNSLQISSLILSQGYEDATISTEVIGEHSSYFTATVQQSEVILAMQALPSDVIAMNSYILLQIVARTGVSSSTTVVNLDIIKDDIVTPLFDQTIYRGSYGPIAGLSVEQIMFVQGFDETVSLDLVGEYSELFQIVDNGPIVTLASMTIPPEMFSLNYILLSIEASKPQTVGANAAIYISLPEARELEFEETSYRGRIEGGVLSLQTILLHQGYEDGVDFKISGEHSTYFTATNVQGQVTVVPSSPLPDTVITQNKVIFLTLTASGINALTTSTNILLDIIKYDTNTPIFDQSIYTGIYSGSVIDIEAINLSQGLDDNVTFRLDGVHAEYFGVERIENNAVIRLQSPIPEDVILKEKVLVFNVFADKALTVGANAAVLIRFPTELTELGIIEFSLNTYVGTLDENGIHLENIVVETGFAPGTELILTGDFAEHFYLSNTTSENIFQLSSYNTLPNEVLANNKLIVLEVEARRAKAVSVSTSLILSIVRQEDIAPVFGQAFYTGSYSEETGLTFGEVINLSEGFDETVTFALSEDVSDWFTLEQEDNALSLALKTPVPSDVLTSNTHLLFTIVASKPSDVYGRAVISIDLYRDISDNLFKFQQYFYKGYLVNGRVTLSEIILEEYTSEVNYSLIGDYADNFQLTHQSGIFTLQLETPIPNQVLEETSVVVITLEALNMFATAQAIIILENLETNQVNKHVEFEQPFYLGFYSSSSGLQFDAEIKLTTEHTNTIFDLEGEDARWFGLQHNENSVTITLRSTIPATVVVNNQQLVFIVTAQDANTNTARATVVISLSDYSQPGSDVAFDKILYDGVLLNGVVDHETITLNGFSGSTVELQGEYSTKFEASVTANKVTVVALDPLSIPNNITHIAIEIHAGITSAVLLVRVSHSVDPGAPSVSFGSTSYAFQVDSYHTGLLGQVQATASNGEAVTYSLLIYDEPLQGRLSVNREGELHLSNQVASGLYTFEVVATTVSSLVQTTATAHLLVESSPVCGDEHVMAPLIVLDVDEEEPHYDLMSATQYNNCHFSLTNRWPLNHTWVYVDERGLHTTAIDREHGSITYMPQSQVQVEVILRCDGDSTRIKRSVTSDALGPYDYGSNKWILADTISFNARRSVVNIIVNDINDNAPIFVGKENEPTVVGYPVPELAERILPRSLVELQATDADIGENAALLYWSSAEQLAVAPTSGFVHLRDGATLENGLRLTVSATDRNGQGLTGSISILVRLLDKNYIAVVTVRDAFFDDEQTIISSLSDAIGYDLKVMKSVVISDEAESSRTKRDVSNPGGASLQMYLYGLMASEPVSVERLTSDLTSIVTAPVIIASSVSLQDHLEGQQICVIAGRDTGLLVATIVLSVLLFILLVLIAVWFFLRWRKNRNYDQFSDAKSIASANVSADGISKSDSMPRLDIAELKKSERRLQEMLETPVQEINVEPRDSKNDAIVNLPDSTTTTSIVTIDKLKDGDDMSEDEFGENKTPRRKSVVTFNENVEKIIMQDTPDAEDVTSEPEFEVYKL